MFDIALYGHLTVDRIFDGETETKALGAMANVWDGLLTVDPSLKIGMSPTFIGEAYIYCDLATAQRYSRAKLNMRPCPPNLVDARVSHVLYLNHLDDEELLKTAKGLVCADVCAGKQLDRKHLPHLDLLFLSDEDIGTLEPDLGQVRGWVIVHSPGEAGLLQARKKANINSQRTNY